MNQKMRKQAIADVHDWPIQKIAAKARECSAARRNNAFPNWSPIARVQGVEAMRQAVAKGAVHRFSMCF